MARLEAFLGVAPAHVDFRGHLVSWLDDLP